MAVGAFLTGLTHFFMGRYVTPDYYYYFQLKNRGFPVLLWRRCVHSYKYDTVIQVFQNDSVNIAACQDPLKTEDVPPIEVEPTVDDKTGKQVSADTAKEFILM